MKNNLAQRLEKIVEAESDILYSSKYKNPGDIYHYTSASALLSILQNDVVHLTSGEFMNDYSDGKYIRKVINTFCKKNEGKHDDVLIEFIKWYFRELTVKDIDNDLSGVRLSNKNRFVFSFTFKRDSQNMWSNYSNHEGYCIKLNYKKLIECFEQAAFDFEMNYHCSAEVMGRKIIYSELKQEKIINDIYQKIMHEWLSAGGRYDDIHQTTVAFALSVVNYADIFKDPLFEEEEEYRIIVSVLGENSRSNEITKFKLRSGVIIPYIEMSLKTEDNTSPIELIRIGPKNNIDVAKEGITFLLESKNFKNQIQVVRSEMSLRF